LFSTVPKRFDDDQPLATGLRFGKYFVIGAQNWIQQGRGLDRSTVQRHHRHDAKRALGDENTGSVLIWGIIDNVTLI
jgi:hypothetical protein